MKEIYVILHNIRSTFNVGSIFRTADAACVKKIFLTGYTPRPDKDEKIAKTALGSEKHVDWKYYSNVNYLLKKLKKERIYLVAVEQSKKSIPYYKFNPKFPLALILGNEVRGLSKNILDKTDIILEIPMLGKKESLNVTVAFGIIVYSIVFKKVFK